MCILGSQVHTFVDSCLTFSPTMTLLGIV